MTAAKTSPRTGPATSPNGEASGGATLSEFIADALARSTEADPHVIARRLLPKLPDEFRDSLILAGLVEQVTVRVRQVREGGLVPRREGQSRWRVAQRVCVAGDWKSLENCDLSDLQTLASQHQQLAEQNLSRAAEFEALADRLRASGCRTVGELLAGESEGLAA